MLLLSVFLDQCPVAFNSVSPLFNDMFLLLIASRSSGTGRLNSFLILSGGLFFGRLYDPSAFSTLLLLAQSQFCLSLAWHIRRDMLQMIVRGTWTCERILRPRERLTNRAVSQGEAISVLE